MGWDEAKSIDANISVCLKPKCQSHQIVVFSANKEMLECLNTEIA